MSISELRKRKIVVSRSTKLPLNRCTARDLDGASAQAKRLRDREARRVQSHAVLDMRARSRKIESAVAHAVNAEFYRLLSQALEAKRYGAMTLLRRRQSTALSVAHLPDKTVAELLATAVAHVEQQASFVNTA